MLDPKAGAWKSRPLAFAANTTFSTLWGNLGSVRAYDSSASELFVLMAQGTSEELHLGRIDATSGTVTSHARLHGDVGISGEIILSLAI